ncbi:unnamed protein product [Hydatigera taeniaeformis]|uniref:Uncharacterized protein n=1 Tax=Hydatigena taeniaeformis TaxID=6205 RepID=A0A0R3XBB6_HYDTA|nr:unnamed protein product [Hydatigera taeniaeformis]
MADRLPTTLPLQMPIDCITVGSLVHAQLTTYKVGGGEEGEIFPPPPTPPNTVQRSVRHYERTVPLLPPLPPPPPPPRLVTRHSNFTSPPPTPVRGDTMCQAVMEGEGPDRTRQSPC